MDPISVNANTGGSKNVGAASRLQTSVTPDDPGPLKWKSMKSHEIS